LREKHFEEGDFGERHQPQKRSLARHVSSVADGDKHGLQRAPTLPHNAVNQTDQAPDGSL